MALTPEDWHLRYVEQARWTGGIQKYLFEKSNLSDAKHVLDVGIGTGALEINFVSNFNLLPFGLDIDFDKLSLARTKISNLSLVQGDARWLPYESGAFQISFCHFVLLWVDLQHNVISEMARVTEPGGAVITIAEPDYGGRIDYPETLEQIGAWQFQALRQQGADPHSGRKLLKLFNQAGLTEIEVGVIGGQWTAASPSVEFDSEFDSEWKVIEADLEIIDLPPSARRLANRLKQEDASARFNGNRILYVPTFYAWGKVPR